MRPGKYKSEIFGFVEQAHEIVVYAGNFYGTGKLHSPGRQGVFLEQEWGTDLKGITEQKVQIEGS